MALIGASVLASEKERDSRQRIKYSEAKKKISKLANAANPHGVVPRSAVAGRGGYKPQIRA